VTPPDGPSVDTLRRLRGLARRHREEPPPPPSEEELEELRRMWREIAERARLGRSDLLRLPEGVARIEPLEPPTLPWPVERHAAEQPALPPPSRPSGRGGRRPKGVMSIEDAGRLQDVLDRHRENGHARGVLLEGRTFARSGLYDAIQALRTFGYSRTMLAAHAAAAARGERSTEPRPPILVGEHDGSEYIAVGQLGTFVRHHLGYEGSDRRIVGRVIEIGGQRIVREAWNVDRTHKPRLVLVRLPPRDVYDDGEEGS
jgi:hypothetical protein